MGFPCGSAGKESTCNAGDLGSIPGLGRSPGEGKVYPFQYSGLENSMNSIVHGVARSWTWLSDFNFHFPHFHCENRASQVALAVKNLPANAGDHGWIPGSRRSAKEWTGYPLQYSWSSLVVQLVKNLPAIRETWVQSLGGKIPWKREVYPLQYSGLENSMDCIVHGIAKSQTWLSDFHFHSI